MLKRNPSRSADQPTGVARRISWGDPKGNRRVLASLFLCATIAVTALVPALQNAPLAAGEPVSVIVRKVRGAGSAPETLVRSLGGTVGLRMGIIHGFAADVPRVALRTLTGARGISSVTPDATMHSDAVNGYDASTDKNSMYSINKLIGASNYWSRGFTGQGVDVALLDTGVVPVDGLSTPGKVINGPDLSFESQVSNLRYLDSNGHGTFMAGIIAGKDNSVTSVTDANADQFQGVAPDARLVNVKVGDAYGATDISQVIAGIDWVVQHRSDNGMNIKVLNISFGTDGTQAYTLDPLAHAVETAWRKGIVVVASAGNDGYGSTALSNPAYDPYVVAVGAVDLNGTATHSDDNVPGWSSTGDGQRNPDLVAPGTSIVSLRDPGSQIDQLYPSAVVGGRFFRGSGTSQSTAVVSGAVALILQERPGITPDQVKGLMTGSATKVPGGNPQAQGKGALDLDEARLDATPNTVQTFPQSSGLGTIEGSRGSGHLTADGIELRGEKDIFGTPWVASTWGPAATNGTTWSGGNWNGYPWTGSTWTTNSWTGNAWGSVSWTRNSWSGTGWTRNSWSKNSWSRSSWSGSLWKANKWAMPLSFTRQSWSTNRWGA